MRSAGTKHIKCFVLSLSEKFSDKVLCDIQFGNIERSTKTDNKIDYAQFEIPAHKWSMFTMANTALQYLTTANTGTE